jgi:hypothetical protein
MQPDTTTILLGSLALAFLILAVAHIRVEMRLRKILAGKAENLEESIGIIRKELKSEQTFKKEIETYLTTVETRLRKSIQGVHTLRFNPFKGTGAGGNQSFAAAFLNEEGDGIVISSLYSREHVSVFSKPVKKAASEFELTVEEQEAIAIAKKSLSAQEKKA